MLRCITAGDASKHIILCMVLGASLQGLFREEGPAKVFNTVMALALAFSVVMIFW